MRIAGFVLALIVCGAWAGADHHRIVDAEFTVSHVRGPIYMLQGRGGNVAASVGEDGVLIIDDEWGPLSQKLRAALKGLRDEPVTFVLNTHHHADHTGGNAAFGAEARIVAHENVRQRLSSPRKFDPKSLPVVTFENSLSIQFNGDEIRMVHFPHGHTDGDSVVFFEKSNVVHMGDLLFTTSFPSFYPNEGGSIEGYVRNVADVLERIHEDAIVIAGHGRIAAKEDVRAFHGMLRDTVEIVRGQVKAGADMETVRENGLPPRFHHWASDFTSVEAWVAKVYSDLVNSEDN